AAGWRARLVARRLARYRSTHVDGGAFVWRVSGHDAEGRWAIRLLARSLLAALGFPLRLDSLSCYSDRDNRGRGCRIRALHRCARALGFGEELSDRAYPFWRLCAFAFHRAVRRPRDDCAPHLHEYARVEARQARAKHFHDSKNRRAH